VNDIQCPDATRCLDRRAELEWARQRSELEVESFRSRIFGRAQHCHAVRRNRHGLREQKLDHRVDGACRTPHAVVGDFENRIGDF
jgi:hypothetical protein